MTIELTYKGGTNQELDNKIIKALESIGLECYDIGTDYNDKKEPVRHGMAFKFQGE